MGILSPEERSLLEYPLEGNWKPEYWARFIKGGFTPDKEGRIKIPESPGLGIEIDWNIIQRFGKRIYHGTASNVAIAALRDRGLKQSIYLKGKKEQQAERSSKAQFAIPKPPF